MSATPMALGASGKFGANPSMGSEQFLNISTAIQCHGEFLGKWVKYNKNCQHHADTEAMWQA